MTRPATTEHRTLGRVHPNGSATWSCSCGTTEGARPQSPPYARARQLEHAGRVHVPEPWQDYGDARDLARAEAGDERADALADTPRPYYSR